MHFARRAEAEGVGRLVTAGDYVGERVAAFEPAARPDPFARAAANREALGVVLDADRILALPYAPALGTPEGDARAVAAAEAWTAALRLDPTASPLRPVQGLALAEIAAAAASGSARGVFGAIGIGHGKTLISLLAASVAAADRPLLLVPPDMREPLTAYIAEWRTRYDLTVPHIMAYSELSSPQAARTLDYYRPDMLIADEVHNLRHRTAARTKRVETYLKEHPECRCILMTGSPTKSSLMDYAHLIDWALREFAPLPSFTSSRLQWASVLDADGDPDSDSMRAIWPLAARVPGAPADPYAGGRDFEERRGFAREGYRRRVTTVPGYIATVEASAAQMIWLRGVLPTTAPAKSRVRGVPDVVSDLLERLEETWTLPDPEAVADDTGDEIDNAMAVARAAMGLAAGFYYRWKWPGSRRDEAWLDRRRWYHGEVRKAVARGVKGLDSPFLLGGWLARHAAECVGASPDPATAYGQAGFSASLAMAYKEWHAVRPSGRGADPGAGVRWCDVDPPPTETVWVDRWFVDDVVRRVRAPKAPPTLVWFQSRALNEAFREAGLTVHGAGSGLPAGAPGTPEYGRPVASVCVSIKVFGTGKNLQPWAHNLVAEPPASGLLWDQMIGRTHRPGQLADEVTVEAYTHTDGTRGAVYHAANEALYTEQTQGQPHRLRLATWTGTLTRPKGF